MKNLDTFDSVSTEIVYLEQAELLGVIIPLLYEFSTL